VTTSVVGALSLVLAACGSDDDDSTGGGSKQTVDVRMVDNDFQPASLSLHKGDTVTFRFTNVGSQVHEAFIGNADAQDEHEKEMTDKGDDSDKSDMADEGATTTDGGSMGGNAADKDEIEVRPSQSGELTYTFDKTGTFEVGCHEPGHYAGGMKIHITVD
jgi:uncharacterized cupredoxin-like copper-binding protein